MGWSGPTQGWTRARQNLDSIIGEKRIKFRIVYGENASSSVTDGFAFDNVYIGQRAKTVLFEQFANLSGPLDSLANTRLNNVLRKAGIDAISVQYHTNFPGADSLNAQNPADPIKDRGQRWHPELLVSVQDAHYQPAQAENCRGNQDYAQQVDCQR